MAWQPEEGREHPEIYVISNVVKDGNAIGFLGDTEVDWHTDLCHSDLPPKATTLYALEIPTDGSGDTGYMNMYGVLEALPQAIRKAINGRELKHEDAHTLQGELRHGVSEEKSYGPWRKRRVLCTLWCARIRKLGGKRFI